MGILGGKGLKLVHINVSSILGAHKFEMLRQHVEGSDADVFCASETWLTQDVPNELIKIRGFSTMRVDRTWSVEGDKAKKGGGLICYVKEGIACNEFKYAFLNNSCKDLEMQWVTLESGRMRRIVLINIYRPPQGNYRVACKMISEAIKEADLKDNAEIFLLGDFNIDLKNRKSPATKEIESLATIWGLKAQITGVTRPTFVNGECTGGSCIDNIFTNSEHIAEARTLDWNYRFVGSCSMLKICRSPNNGPNYQCVPNTPRQIRPVWAEG